LTLQNILDDANFLIVKEKKEEARRSEASGALYNTLLSYVGHLSKQVSVDRNTLQARLLQVGISASDPSGTQNIVRIYEKALRAQQQLSQLEKESKDPNKLLLNELNEVYLKALISFYITLNYASMKQYHENFALCQHTITEIENCLDFVEKNLLTKFSGATEVRNDLQHRVLPEVLKSKALAHAKILQQEIAQIQ
jgi:hypothetical protein